jgi:hypothetical protein
MFQVARIKMDEEGTEAAAVTVIETTDGAGPYEPEFHEFHADRPFLYVISERSTGTILFIGQYMGENVVSGNTTAIDLRHAEETENSKWLDGKCFDLSGRKLSAPPAKGLYIDGRTGRKVLVK